MPFGAVISGRSKCTNRINHELMKRIVACYDVSPSYTNEFKQFIVDVPGGRTYSLEQRFWAFLSLPTVITNIFIRAPRATYFAMNADITGMLGDLLWAIQFAVCFVGCVGLVDWVRTTIIVKEV